LFLKKVWLSFRDLTCYPYFFEMLGVNHLYTCYLFPTRWSPYYFQCNDTCWNRHFSLPIGFIKYLSFITLDYLFLGPLPPWKSCGTIVSSLTSFFNKPLTRTKVCHTFNRCSFKRHASAIMKAWLLTCPITPTFYLSSSHFFTTLHTNLGFSTSYSCTFFTLSIRTYYCLFEYPLVLVPIRKWWAHYNPWYSSKYHFNYCF
jgi:hypothetical protein